MYRKYDYADRGNAWNLEMRPLSYELLRAGCVTWLDPRFNYPWDQYKALHFPFLLNRPDHPRAPASARAALADVHFLHFCGEHEQVELLARKQERAPRGRASVRTVGSVSALPLTTPIAWAPGPDRAAAERALGAIRQGRPRRLLLAGTSASWAAAEIDWGCELEIHPDPQPGPPTETLLDWAFDRVEEVIVLEGACVPDPSFFRFCGELLERYRDDPSVASITGAELSSALERRPERYRYSRYQIPWGWATWRSAWLAHDRTMVRWPARRGSGWLEQLLADRRAARFWDARFERAHNGQGSWSDAWTFSCWDRGALAVVPELNLVSNHDFGFDAPATPESMFASMPVRPAGFPLVAPTAVAADEDYDEFLEDVMFSGNVGRLFARIRARRPAPTLTGSSS